MRDQIKQVIARSLGVDAARIADDSSVDSMPEWDSLRHIELMLALETDFGVHISTAEMLELLSLEAIEHHLQRELRVKPESTR
jgi:acyl carrier protein